MNALQTRTLRKLALLLVALGALACMPSCNTVAGIGKDIQAIAGGGQDVVDDISGTNRKGETY